MRHAISEATKMIRMVACDHKIGMCLCPYERFHFYQEPDSRWNPWLIALLASTKTRERANMMEASLILHFETTGINIEHNFNWTTATDYGGEGPTRDHEAHLEHFVYLALKPLPQPVDEWTAASAHLPEELNIGDMTRNRWGTMPCPFAVQELCDKIFRDGWGPAAAGGADRPEEHISGD